ncbi:RpiR family transcriptional regulator [Palleronia aestuarii]|uniref:RpiR family transcriptional regulator n=2 Tax=Palleronia aestuarii TaxID=568105 RepID=A0A2W7NLN2_9RHOB|nr:RpiR family transcriptional regulator [Palleronia aestuarii]
MQPEGGDILDRIRAVRGGLKPSMQNVAEEVLARPDAVRTMSLRDLSQACGVSEASISRFVRGIGLQNYREFVVRMAERPLGGTDTGTREASGVYESIGRDDTAESILYKISHRQMDVARAAMTTLDPVALEEGAGLVCAARAILFVAAGSSSLAAENGVVRFGRIGCPATFHRDCNTQVILAAAICTGSVVVAISDSGRTDQTLEAVAAAQRAGVRCIAVTSYPDAPLARMSDVVLQTPPAYEPSGEEPLYESMVSKFGQLAAIDALYSLCAVREFDRATTHLVRGNPHIRLSRTRRPHAPD